LPTRPPSPTPADFPTSVRPMTSALISSAGDPALAGRHPGVRELVGFFAFDHLPDGPIREASARCSTLALDLVNTLPDSPELTVALRKLLEAKDCAVRCAVRVMQAAGRHDDVAEGKRRGGATP
jgi:hypothetical protein